MPKYTFYSIIMLGSFYTVSALGQEDGEALISGKLCYACHQMESTAIGPPWRAIAARHAPRKAEMTNVLATKIMFGGGGNWGVIPMVPSQHVNMEEAKKMAAWVLEQVPDSN